VIVMKNTAPLLASAAATADAISALVSNTCVQPLNRRKAMGLLLAGAATAHQVQAQVLVPSTAGTASAAGADTRFPRNKIVKIVVAYPPAGDTGILGQLIAELLSAQWGSNVMVEYKPGATGIIGTRDVIANAPDGYTLLVAPNSVAIAPHLTPSYDVLKDLTPIAKLIDQPIIAVVNSASGVTDLRTLVQKAKAGALPGYASPGHGSTMHIVGELFNQVAGMQLQEIPYKGTMPAITDLVGGQVPLMYTTLNPVQNFLKTGQLRAIGVIAPQRVPFLPQVPTFAESGYPQVDISTWQALLGPANMPAALVQQINHSVNAALQTPKAKALLQQWAMQPVTESPQALKHTLEQDYARYGKLISQLHIS